MEKIKADDFMIVTACRSGQVSYGLRIRRPDRNKFFKREWKTVKLSLSGHPGFIEVNIKDSFWGRCSELINKEIKRWLLELLNKGLVTWTRGMPPKFSINTISGGYFSVIPPEK